MPSEKPTLLLKPKEAAAELAISDRKLWELTHSGRIPFLRIDKSIRYSREALAEWIENRIKSSSA